MPTYEYRCNACKHEFELFQSMTAKPITRCPECGKKKVERLIGTGAALLFKGSGFYQTDYRTDSYKKGSEAEKKSSESAAPAKSESSDAKPAASSASSKPDASPAPKAGESKASHGESKASRGRKSKA